MRRFACFAALAVLLLFPTPTPAGKNSLKSLLSAETISTAGGAATATQNNGSANQGYLVVVTSTEVATASLAVVVSNVIGTESIAVCTLSAITTETTTVVLLGSTLTAGEGIDEACDFPIGRQLSISYTVSGAGASFDVDSWIELQAE